MYGFVPPSRWLMAPLLCLIAFFSFLLLPFNLMCERHARLALVETIYSCYMAPLTTVKFRHFFLADIMTSASTVFTDSALISCFMAASDFANVT
jgi:hypothetical protein